MSREGEKGGGRVGKVGRWEGSVLERWQRWERWEG